MTARQAARARIVFGIGNEIIVRQFHFRQDLRLGRQRLRMYRKSGKKNKCGPQCNVPWFFGGFHRSISFQEKNEYMGLWFDRAYPDLPD
jgi:hypothetical protein